MEKPKSETTIESLPLGVLTNILTFLPIKEAMKFSILSKSWKELWKTSWTLSFDFRNHEAGFGKFVERTLLQQQGHIQNLSLIVNDQTSTGDLHVWVGFAIQRGLRKLYIQCLRERGQLVFPQFILKHKGLIFLRLEGSIQLEEPIDFSLDNLMVIELCNVQCSAKTVHLINQSPNLKEMSICYSTFGKRTVFDNPCLETLRIYDYTKGVADRYTVTCPRIATFRGSLRRIPSGILKCESLSTLGFCSVSCADSDIPASLCLPNLKTFTSKRMVLKKTAFCRLLDGFPRLENLFIEFFRGKNCEHNYIISVPTLQQLTVKNTAVYDYQAIISIHLYAPGVRNLLIHDNCCLLVNSGEMPLIAVAALQHRIRKTTMFLKSIHYVQKLSICLPQDISEEMVWVSFSRLEELTLCTCGTDWCSWLDLLPHCPILRFLQIGDHAVRSVKYNTNTWKQPLCPPKFPHLKEFHWRQFHGTKQDRKLLRFLLQVSPELKNVTISKSFPNGTTEVKVKCYQKQMCREFREYASRLSLKFVLD